MKWYGNYLDRNILEHQELVRLIDIFIRDHLQFRNNLAHSGLSLNVDTGAFEAMNADGSSESISVQELQQKIAELNTLKEDLNSGIAKSISAHNRTSPK